MKTKGMLRMELLSMVIATSIVNTPDSFASDVSRVDVMERIGHGGSMYSSNPPRTEALP